MSDTVTFDQPTSFVRPGNGYSFHCPVVDRDTRFMACQFIRFKVWRGENVSAPDCKCAMRGGKCPALEMIRQEDRGESKFFDSEIKMHSLPKDVQERIQNVMLVPYHAQGVDLSPAQREQLFGASANAFVATGREVEKPSSTLSGKRRQTNRRLGTADADLTTGLVGIVHDESTLINAAMEA